MRCEIRTQCCKRKARRTSFVRDEANESTRSIAWRAHAARSSNPHVGTSDEVTSAEARASDSAVLRQEPAGSVGGDEEDLAPDSRCASESTSAASPDARAGDGERQAVGRLGVHAMPRLVCRRRTMHQRPPREKGRSMGLHGPRKSNIVKTPSPWALPPPTAKGFRQQMQNARFLMHSSMGP